MAENKNTVVVYTDWGNIFDKLEDVEAGKLIKHFFNYVRDQNPDAPDRLTELVFEPIKQTLKRDLKKWAASLEKKSDSGSMGNLKRWHKELYEKVVANEITIDEAIASIASATKTSQVRQKQSHRVANIAVSGTVSVNGTVTEENTKILTDEDKAFKKFEDWIANNASNVGKMKEPFTMAQYKRIMTEYPNKDEVKEILQIMHNWKDLVKKRVSANLTFRTFIRNERARKVSGNGFQKQEAGLSKPNYNNVS